MKDKKTMRITLSTFFLVIAIIVIIIMGVFIFVQHSKSNSEIETLKNNTTNLQDTIDSLQTKINEISNTITDDNTKSENLSANTISNQNVSSKTEVTEKQTLNANGYNITLYSNNEVKIVPVIKDLQTILGNTRKYK